MEAAAFQTDSNLMRAFSGETQAWARYVFAAKAARTQGYDGIGELFDVTANQEKEHAEILWRELCQSGRDTVDAAGSWPADPRQDVLSLLRQAAEHEFQEANRVYPAFADAAAREARPAVAALFRALAEAERIHGARFSRFADAWEQGILFRGGEETVWICLHCGHEMAAAEPPAACPLCTHPAGGFVRKELFPFQS